MLPLITPINGDKIARTLRETMDENDKTSTLSDDALNEVAGGVALNRSQEVGSLPASSSALLGGTLKGIGSVIKTLPGSTSKLQ